MAKNILIAGARSKELAEAARRYDFFPVVMRTDVEASEAPEEGLIVRGDSTSAEAITEMARGHSVVGIVAATEAAAAPVAQAANELGLPGASPWAAIRAHNKVALRQALAAKGLPNPAYREVVDADEAEQAARDIGLPVIVKPADGHSSLGVRRVDYAEDMGLAFPQALKQSALGVVLVESWMEGAEFSVDGIKVDGEFHVFAIAARERANPVYPVATEISMPASVDTSTYGALVAMARAALTAIGMMTGPAHVELIMTETGPQVVEIGAHFGAVRTEATLIRLASGVECLKQCLRAAAGEPIQISTDVRKGAAVRWIPSPTGVVAKVSGIDTARALPGVHDVFVGVEPGERVGHVTDCVTRDQVGHVIAAGNTAEEAVAVVRNAVAHCRIQTHRTR